MSYTPNNIFIFQAAFSGALSGMGVFNNQPIATNSAVWDPLSAVAGAWAQAFDTAWGSNQSNDLIIELVEEMSNDFWAGRSPNGPSESIPATWTSSCNALIVAINSAISYFSGQGIIPSFPSGGNPKTMTQAAWYIDPQNSTGLAKDSNDGASPLRPLLTDLRRQQLMGVGQIAQNPSNRIDINFLSDANPSDPFDFSNVVLGQNMSLYLNGHITSGRSGTWSAVTPIDNTTALTGGNGLTLTDAVFGGSWTPGTRVRLTSGAHIGAVGYVTKNIGGGQAVFTTFCTPFSLLGVTEITPAIGDNYVVETESDMYFAENVIRTRGHNGGFPDGFFTRFLTSNCHVKQVGLNWIDLIASEALLPILFDRCTLDATLRCDTSLVGIFNCYDVGGELQLTGSKMQYNGGFLSSNLNINDNGTSLFLDQNVYITNTTGSIQVSAGGVCGIGSAGFFDCVKALIIVAPGGFLALGEVGGSTFQFDNVAMYGNGNLDQGIHVDPAGTFVYQGAPDVVPIVKSALSELELGDSTVAQYWDAASGTYLPAAGIALTYAGLLVAQPVGFGGNATNPSNGAKIVKADKHTA